MTLPSIERTKARETGKIEEPSRNWVNWWQAPHDCYATNLATGERVRRVAGEVFNSLPAIHETQEQAEAFAIDVISRAVRERKRGHLVFLGAFAEGERP